MDFCWQSSLCFLYAIQVGHSFSSKEQASFTFMAAVTTCRFVCVSVCEVAHLCPTLCDPMDYSLPGSSVHGILQAGILEWVAICFSRGSFQPRDRTQGSCIAGRFFAVWATRKAIGGHMWGRLIQPIRRDWDTDMHRGIACEDSHL